MNDVIDFIDLRSQQRHMHGRVERAIARVLDHGRFIMGPEVTLLEERLADRCGVRHVVTCSSGTDALLLSLLAWGVGEGDAVFVPTFTFAATAEVVVLAGATPVFVDVDRSTFNLDLASLNRAIEDQNETNLRPVGIIPVDMFGQPADYGEIATIAKAAGLWVLADAAQSFGASAGGRPSGSLGDLTATSFFPAKPLGCYGDGGAIFTDDDACAETLRSLRAHGQGTHKYENVRIGLNGRLDTIQAAVLLEKLDIFDEELSSRQCIAARYTDGLSGAVGVPIVGNDLVSAWAQYTVMLRGRDQLASKLGTEGIPTAVYYPKPLHQQHAYTGFPCATGGLDVASKLSQQVLSLPMHPYLQTDDQSRIIDAVLRYAAAV